MLGQLDAHQQPAVRAAVDAELRGAGDAARDQIAADAGEIVEDQLALRLATRLVPGRAELTAAADVGEHEGAAALQPQLADDAGIIRRVRHLEAAIGGHQRGRAAVFRHAITMDDEIRHPGAVGRYGLELLDDEPGCVEARGERLHRHRRCVARQVERHQPRRRGEAGHREITLVRGDVGGDEIDRQIVRQRQGAPLPAMALRREHHRAAADIVIDRGNHRIPGDPDIVAVDRLPRRGRIDRRRRRGAVTHRRQRQRGERPFRHPAPRLAGAYDQAAVDQPLYLDLVRHGELRRRAARFPKQDVGGEEGLGAGDHHRAIALPVNLDRGPDADVVGRAAIDLLRRRQRLAALHDLDHHRIARLGQRPLAPVPRDDQRIGIDPVGILLGRGQIEPALDKPRRDEIEFAQRGRILAAFAERHEATAFIGLQAGDALPHPLPALRRR